MIEICTVGGYTEVGRNCTAIKVDDEVVLLDLGIHLDSYIEYTEEEDIKDISPNALVRVGAVPDVRKIAKWRSKVSAIVIGHAHLDHLGAVPFLAKRYDAPVIGTPFTIAVLENILQDERIKLPNSIKTLNPNSRMKISEKIEIEFINVTHSTPQTVMVAIHTPYGTILYANDFKFDSFPTLGKKADFKRLKAIGKEGVKALIVDSLYADDAKKTPSENIAKNLLKDVVMGTDSTDHLILVTTFSSHLARLKTIKEFAKNIGRKCIFLGRSLAKYIDAGQKANIIDFSDSEIVKYGAKIKKRLMALDGKDRSKFMLVVTGHQGEPKAVLARMARGEIPFHFRENDLVIFSCSVIPTKLNKAHRKSLENQLKKHKVRIFSDIHVSGHASREDHRDLLNMIKPKYIIPAHAEKKKRMALKELALSLGYKSKFILIVNDGDLLKIA